LIDDGEPVVTRRVKGGGAAHQLGLGKARVVPWRVDASELRLCREHGNVEGVDWARA
jgi:hypothetical protein